MTPELYDNTRIQDFRRCPRYYYFRHLRDWVPDKKRIPLIFGGCWHCAMEAVWAKAPAAAGEAVGYRADIVEAGMDAFMAEWRKYEMPEVPLPYEVEQELSPRTPGNAREMLINYVDKRWSMWRDPSFKLLSVEKPFAVPLAPGEDDTLWFVGRIDKVFEYRSKIIGAEHKTTTEYKKNGPFRSTFVDSFSPNTQVDGYQYALHILYPQRVGGIWVDATLVHRSEEGLMFIPVERQRQQLDAWLWETRYWIEQIRLNKELLGRVKPYHGYMQAFPKDTSGCFRYNAPCDYLDLCKAWPNPVDKLPPVSHRVEHWDPLSHIGRFQSLEELLSSVH